MNKRRYEQTPEVSVIIVNYFSTDVLPRCLETISDAYELIIIDNSVDKEEAQSLQRLIAARAHSRLEINEKNLGFARAVNQGAAQAAGKAILMLNPDAYLTKGALGRLYEELCNDGVAAVGPLIQFPDGQEQPGARRLTPTPTRAFAKLFGLSRFGLVKDHNLAGTPLPNKPQAVEALSGACMLVKTDLYQRIGGMDEGYVMHCEDLDLCMQFRILGHKLMFVPDAVVIHEKGHSSKKQPLWVVWHLHKGMLRYYHKFFKHRYSPLLWPAVVLGVYARFALYSLASIVLRIVRP